MTKTSAPKERQETLRISKKLNKFIPLPSFLNWKVHESDLLHRGRVLCMLRTKRIFLPDDISYLKMRVATVTKQGFMVLYEKVDRGLIIDLRSASHVLTECDKYKTKRMKYSRSHIKVRLPRGNMHIYVRDEEIPKWTAAILTAHVVSRPKPIPKAEAVVVEESVPVVEPVTAIENALHFPSSPMTSSNSGLVTVIEKSSLSDGSQIQSVRHGHVSVDLLRRQLENQVPVKESIEAEIEQRLPKSERRIESKFITSLFVLHEGNQIAEADEEIPAVPLEKKDSQDGSEGKPKKEWWMRSLRC